MVREVDLTENLNKKSERIMPKLGFYRSKVELP